MGDCGATMGLTLYQSITPTSQQGVEGEQEVRDVSEILFVEKNKDVFCSTKWVGFKKLHQLCYLLEVA